MDWYRSTIILFLVLALLQIVYYFPQLPDTLASHFDGLGAADGWSSKAAFFGLYIILMLLLILGFFVLPVWLEKRPNFGRKIPQREFWLAPARIEQTKSWLRRQMMFAGILHLVLMIFIIQLVIVANFDAQPQLDASIAWALGLYFCWLLAWIMHLYRHFKNTR